MNNKRNWQIYLQNIEENNIEHKRQICSNTATSQRSVAIKRPDKSKAMENYT